MEDINSPTTKAAKALYNSLYNSMPKETNIDFVFKSIEQFVFVFFISLFEIGAIKSKDFMIILAQKLLNDISDKFLLLSLDDGVLEKVKEVH